MLFGFMVAVALSARCLNAQQIVNGQIFTPGIAIVDSPQPNTPLGGDHLQVAIDVSSDGQLQLPPYPSNPVSAIYNITIFLSSDITGWNFTISNGTASNGSLGEIMAQENGSTVKHVNWVWPDCLVGKGPPGDNDSARGLYNISIRQNFRLNGSDEYTIFDLPIHVTNSIPAQDNRSSCASLNNTLLNESALVASANNFTRIPGTPIQGHGNSGSGLGGPKPDANPGNGLGGAGMLDWRTGLHVMWIGAAVFMLAL
ncbi:hypothetical protein F5882DRAFT_441619 [Hyaloscypha sp. PMI_1271]|nr:hypothetical protein F5882DRAFT_441619 [Hyaloscypha sp. PMI_1271]